MQMFDLVADVEKYPQFLPLCESLNIRSRREREGREILVAEMGVGYKAIRQRFTTQVVLDRAQLVIDVKYLDGPFRRLDNRWRFEPTGEHSCNVHFDIDYEFASRSLGLLMGSMSAENGQKKTRLEDRVVLFKGGQLEVCLEVLCAGVVHVPTIQT
jgi:coenzyme Q-binding protein COQ10